MNVISVMAGTAVIIFVLVLADVAGWVATGLTAVVAAMAVARQERS